MVKPSLASQWRQRRPALTLAVLLVALALVAVPPALADSNRHASHTPRPGHHDELPELDQLLVRLDETAQLYLNNALRFTCDETIFHNMGNGYRVFRFNYIYAFNDEQGLQDHRLTRRGWDRIANGKRAPESAREVQLYEYGLPTWMSRAYNWIFIFEEGRWPAYHYEVLGREVRMERPALKVWFEPKEPHKDRLDEWVGTAWVDSETHQLLYVEASRLYDHKAKQQLEDDLEHSRSWKSRKRAHHSIFSASTIYAVERDGMRFPSEVRLSKTRYVVRGGKRPPNFYEYPGWEVRQSYDNYRLFGIETQGKVGKYFDRYR